MRSRTLLNSVLVLSSFHLSFSQAPTGQLEQSTPQTGGDKILISIDSPSLAHFSKMKSSMSLETLHEQNGLSLVKMPLSQLEELSQQMHLSSRRCAGFFAEDSLESFKAQLEDPEIVEGFDYRVKDLPLVREKIKNVDEEKIRAVIAKLSSFQNRYCRSRFGVESQTWVYNTWRDMLAGQDYAQIELFPHRNFIQPSVILTVKGSKKPDDIIVIGAHGDSIVGFSPREDVESPGADDNASGVATVTEIIRVMMSEGFRPERTIKFMSYAAEEIGLMGSREIADSFRAKKLNVMGVIQLDMTNFRGSPFDIVLMTDYTDRSQNEFLQSLARTYLPEIQMSTDVCGYACSDHASWTRNGYRASIPFESKMDASNPHIHTREDTLSVSENRARHAINFAKLALAFGLELSVE